MAIMSALPGHQPNSPTPTTQTTGLERIYRLCSESPFSVHYSKGLQRQRLIGSAVAGFNDAMTITKASAKGLDARQDDYNKGICSPGSLVNNPVR